MILGGGGPARPRGAGQGPAGRMAVRSARSRRLVFCLHFEFNCRYLYIFIVWIFFVHFVSIFVYICRLQLKRGLFWYRHHLKMHEMVSDRSSQAENLSDLRKISMHIFFNSHKNGKMTLW